MVASDRQTERKTLTIGTRGSRLALAQTEIVRTALLHLRPDLDIRIQAITTRGDAVQDRPLSQIGGNGVFVRQIEVALSNGEIDVAVHSAKDLPSILSPGTTIAAYLPRADPRDVLVSRDGTALMDLPAQAKVGTSSPRRICLLKALRPDLVLLDIRGNVDTRLRKLQEGHYDAIVLAAAGLERLGLLGEVTQWLETAEMIPAVGQGALAVQVRAEDRVTLKLTGRLDDPDTATAVRAERAFLARIGGDCSLPIGAHAWISGERVTMDGMIGSFAGEMIKGSNSAPRENPEQAGASLAELLLGQVGEVSNIS